MAAEFKVASNIRSIVNNDGGVLLNADNGLVYSLSPIGRGLRRCLQELSFDSSFENLQSRSNASP